MGYFRSALWINVSNSNGGEEGMCLNTEKVRQYLLIFNLVNMDEQDKETIRKMYVRLVETLEAQSILSYLYQEDVLSEYDKEKILSLSASKEMADELLIKLGKRKNGLKSLIKALIFSKIQGFLGNELLEIVTWTEEEMENFKLELEGKIDPQQMLLANNAALKQENNQLKAKLRYCLKDETTKELTEIITEKDEIIKSLNQELEEKNKTIEMMTGKLERSKTPKSSSLTRSPAFKYNGKERLLEMETIAKKKNLEE